MIIYIPCDSSSISVGAENIKNIISDHLPEAKIKRTGSYGLYWLEPMIEVEKDNRRIAYGPLDNNSIIELIKCDFSEQHSLCLGPTHSIDKLKLQNRLTFKNCGIIDPLSLDDYKKQGGLQGLEKALKLSPEEITDIVIKSGLRGRGGAAFPTGIKWKTTLSETSEEKYIVCNADEGDSGTFADRMILEGDPLSVIEGMIIAARATRAHKGYIYLRSEYPYTKTLLEAVLDMCYQHNLLGKNILNSDLDFDIELRIGAGSYICGEETALLESLEGKRGMIRYKPPLPAIKGLFGKPTIVNNVISLASVPCILDKGADFYASFGKDKSLGTLTVQLSGNIKYPGLYEIDFGLPLKELLYEIGGGSSSGKTLKAVQCGGPLGSFLSADKFDIPLTYEDFQTYNAMIGHGGVVVFDETANMAHLSLMSMEFGAEESCGKCTPCRVGTTRAYEIIKKIISGDERTKNISLLQDLCDVMIEGSLCAHGGLIPYPVLSAIKQFPEDFGLSQAA
jgi:formate dehydrogenase iron-sulfur subunit